MARATKTERGYMAICQAYHAGFTRAEIAEYLGRRVSDVQLRNALRWEHEQFVLRSEIESLYDALVEVRALKRQANAILDRQLGSVMGDVSRFAVQNVSDLIDKELEYAGRIRELSAAVVTDSGFADIADLPAGIFTADIEPGGGGDTS